MIPSVALQKKVKHDGGCHSERSEESNSFGLKQMLRSAQHDTPGVACVTYFSYAALVALRLINGAAVKASR